MVTDYLRDYCPEYVRTEDTTVVPFKYYFRKDGDQYARIVDPVASSNPKTSGWYELSGNHNAEFKMNAEDHQMNSIDFVSSLLAKRIGALPKFTLDRTAIVDGISVDFRSEYFDTKWDEVVGSCPAETKMTFSANWFVATQIQTLIKKLIESRLTVDSIILALLKQFVQVCVAAPSNKTYAALGYNFDVTTLGDANRTDDTYTLACAWGSFDFRQYLFILQETLKKYTKSSPSSETTNVLGKVINIFIDSARDVLKLAEHLNSVVIIDATELETKTIDLPSTIVQDGQTFYRLLFTNQLVDDRQYRSAVATYDRGSYVISVPEPKSVHDTSVFTVQSPGMYSYELTAYAGSNPPATSSMDKSLLEQGYAVYTDVPFSGL